MSEGELIALMQRIADQQNAQGGINWIPFLPFLVIAWCELRYLPKVDLQNALMQAIGVKVGVSEADLAALMPKKASLLDRLRGKSTMALLLVTLALGVIGCAGCSMFDANAGIRDNAPKLRSAWRTFRDASEPAPIYSRDAWVNLGDAVEANMREVENAANE